MTFLPQILLVGLTSFLMTSCLNSMMAGAQKESYLTSLAEQAAPVLQLEADMKSGKKMTVAEAKAATVTLGGCLENAPGVLKAGKEETGTPYVELKDMIPVANGPISVGSYYKKCQSMLKKIAKMDFESCQHRLLELRAVGSFGSFADFTVHSSDRSCKSSRPCYEAVINKPEFFVPVDCEEGAAENVPDDFRAHQKKLRKACGSDSKVIFIDETAKMEKHEYEKRMDAKTAAFKCYKDKAKGKPFAKETDRLKSLKESEPELYKTVFGGKA